MTILLFPYDSPGDDGPAIPSIQLGEILVSASRGAEESAIRSVDAELMEDRDCRNIADAATLLPEAAMARAGTRNEKTIRLRGFDNRQVPLFIDGIPVYLPYDGMVDPGRFGTFDLAGLSVARGFSPVIYGPNTLGGALNAVSRRPSDPREVYARAGAFSGDGIDSGIRAALLGPRGYLQAGAGYRSRKFYRVSEDYTPTGAEDGGRRENSDERDLRLWFKGAWTPGEGDEYMLGFMRIDSEKGVPPYGGTDPRIQPRFWRYSEWTKNSIYFIGHKEFGPDIYVKPRLYYDTYANALDSYDDSTYTTQSKRYAFRSIYDDYTFGGSLEAGGQVGEVHAPRVAAHYKQDVHREHYEGDPQSRFSDATWTLALEDSIRLGRNWTLVVGAGWDRRASLDAEDRSGPEPVNYEDNANEMINPQCGLFYSPEIGTFRATAAGKSRFPTMKDRYSYRRGTAIPNPELRPEKAVHYEIGYVGRPERDLELNLSVFYSRLRDAIQQEDNVEYDSETETWLSQYRNIGKAEHRGLEAGLSFRLMPEIKAGIDYALLQVRNISRPDLMPTDAPEHRILSYVEIRLAERLLLLPNVEYNSSRYSSSDGVKVQGFWLFNMDIKLDLPRGFTMSAGIHNIFDTNYELSEGYPEEGRNCYADLAYRF